MDTPSILTALTEQLGLRLEPRRGPVQVYVIEKIEKPAETDRRRLTWGWQRTLAFGQGLLSRAGNGKLERWELTCSCC